MKAPDSILGSVFPAALVPAALLPVAVALAGTTPAPALAQAHRTESIAQARWDTALAAIPQRFVAKPP